MIVRGPLQKEVNIWLEDADGGRRSLLHRTAGASEFGQMGREAGAVIINRVLEDDNKHLALRIGAD